MSDLKGIVKDIRKHLVLLSTLDSERWKILRQFPNILQVAALARTTLDRPAHIYSLLSDQDLHDLWDACRRISDFIMQLSNSTDEARKIITGVSTQHGILSDAATIISILLQMGDAPETEENGQREAWENMRNRIEREAAETRGRLEEQLASTREELLRKQQELQATLENVKKIQESAERAGGRIMNQAAGEGARVQGRHFHTAANQYNWILAIWIIGSLVFAIFIFRYINTEISHAEPLYATVVNGSSPPAPGSYFYTVALLHTILPRLLIIGLYLTGLVFCLRNFIVSRHNQILNRHRALSMDTFLDFVSGAGSEEARSHMVQFVANCVFTPQSTGYVKTDGDLPHFKQAIDLFTKAQGKGD